MSKHDTPKSLEEIMQIADKGLLIDPNRDFMMKLWMRTASTENLCKFIQLLWPGHTIMDIVLSEGEIPPDAWKKMLDDGSIMTEIQKTYHLDTFGTMKVKDPSDPEPYFVSLDVEAQSRDRKDLITRQDHYTCAAASLNCKRGQKYIGFAGKLHALGIVLCSQNINYFADPEICNDPGRFMHHMGGSHYQENLRVSTNFSLSIFVELKKLLSLPEKDRIVLGSPVLGAILESFGGAHKMNGAEIKSVAERGGQPVLEHLRFVADVSTSSIRRNLKRHITSRDAMHAADVIDARSEGKAEGKAEGEAKAQREFAQKLLEDDFEYDKIAQLTGLSVGEVKELSLARVANS